jgi:cell division protein FtsZ
MIFNLINDQNESPIIKVIGVGGGGSNAVNHMFKQGIIGVDFAICNTDEQAMNISPVPTKIQLGPTLTEGRGAGSKPNIGKMACEESVEEVRKYLANGCKMLFVTAGMGGGTGTGAAPIIAKTAQEMDILTVGIVTVPFTFEGNRRALQANDGLEEMKKHVDTLIIISNDKLRQIYGNLSLSNAFSQADNILTTAAKGIAEIITVPGYVNVDFEDVNTVMRDSGVAIMGTAIAEGDNRAKRAVDEALNSPLLEDNNIRGAKHILLNISSGKKEVTMDEIFEITEFVQEEAGHGTDLIWGNCYDEKLGDKLSVTIIATGFERTGGPIAANQPQSNKIVVSLDDEGETREQKPKSKLRDIGFDDEDSAPKANTFEFDDIRSSIDRFHKRPPVVMNDEPHYRKEEKDPSEEERRMREMQDARRRERLRAQQVKLSTPKAINDLESEPAYLRRGIKLEDIPQSNQEPVHSRWTIGEDEEHDMNSSNSYLHDNVD